MTDRAPLDEPAALDHEPHKDGGRNGEAAVSVLNRMYAWEYGASVDPQGTPVGFQQVSVRRMMSPVGSLSTSSGLVSIPR